MRFVVQQTLTVVVEAPDRDAAIAEVGETWTYPWSAAQTDAWSLDLLMEIDRANQRGHLWPTSSPPEPKGDDRAYGEQVTP